MEDGSHRKLDNGEILRFMRAADLPQVFRLDDDDTAQVIDPDPEPALWEAVQVVARRCPRQAIHIEP